jgi:hypothetical protein
MRINGVTYFSEFKEDLSAAGAGTKIVFARGTNATAYSKTGYIFTLSKQEERTLFLYPVIDNL